MRAIGLICLWALTIVSFAPLLGVTVTGAVAARLGCQLDEGSVHLCVVGGFDLGEVLYAAFVLGWLMLLTWPGMVASLGLWAWLLIRKLRRPAAR